MSESEITTAKAALAEMADAAQGAAEACAKLANLLRAAAVAVAATRRNYGHEDDQGRCRAYTSKRAKWAHVLPFGFDRNHRSASALCGIYPGLGGYWLGSGSQDEYDHLAVLPTCPRCEARA